MKKKKKKEKDLENGIQSLEAKIVLTENEKRKLEKGKQEQENVRSPASLESEMDCRR